MNPNVTEYKVGQLFDITGFHVDKMDIYGDSTDITSEIVLKVENTKIYDITLRENIWFYRRSWTDVSSGDFISKIKTINGAV